MEPEKILEVHHLKKYYKVNGSSFRGKEETVKALDDISFDICRGETVGLVGESGCGKTTAGRAILRLIDVTDGEILFKGQDITRASEGELRPLRRSMQIIFQDPYGCLNPRKRIGEIITEPLRLQGITNKKELQEHALELMEEVGLRSDYVDRFPHEFSGGQRQRVGIARAIAADPEFIVCDEPVSALDVSVQAQVLNLIQKLQRERNLTYLFISHDLRVVKHLSDRIIVMYLGSIVECGSKEEIYAHPAHPYTKALLSAVPEVGKDTGERILLEGDIPSPIHLPTGCRFHTRCPRATERCKTEVPPVMDLGAGHLCACHYWEG
jgi:oligopeptide/dipeptide ABC transporter ATP-binding protein